MICIPLTTTSHADALQALQLASSQADIIEIRLDYLDDPACAQEIIAASPLPTIATWRRIEDGGHNPCDDATRLQWLRRAAQWGADYIDVEIECADDFERPTETTIIVSHHDFNSFPADFEERLATISAHPLCDIAKIAVAVDTIQDNLRIFKALKKSDKKTIALGMGELGVISRIASKLFGGYLTFASLAQGAESAPGQITASELRSRFRYDSLNSDTKLYGIIANPVGHSMSPDIHNAAFDELGINALYLPFKVEGDPAQFIRDFAALPIHGYSVTIPHKEGVQAALDEIEPLAAAIGAVNTVVRCDDGSLKGYNSDCWAAIAGVEAKIDLHGKNCLILGAGGAARAIAFGLQAREAAISITNRTMSRAEDLARDCDGSAIAPEDIYSQQWDLILNTTSVGMHPHPGDTPFDKKGLHPQAVVFDAIYNPLTTRLLKEAAAAGAQTIDGVEMFIGQGARQFELWTGSTAPRGIMQEVMLKKLHG